MESFDVTPKRILITGGVRRLGRAIALGFSARGAALGLNYLNASFEEAEATRLECLALGASEVVLMHGDITNDAESIVHRFAELVGGIDILVNNAGVMPMRKSATELTPEQFRGTLELNLLAPFAVCRAAIKYMQPGSAIINLASVGGLMIFRDRIDYNVSKSALITLTQVLASELAPKHITVNAVAPGAIRIADESAQRIGVAEDKIPFGRYGTADDILRAVVYFAFDAPYVTGQCIAVDGGRSL